MELITIAGGLLLIITLVGVVWGMVRWRRLRSKDLRRRLRDISRDVLADFFVPDGNGGEIHIDHLLLTEQGLVLLETKDVSGTVFAGDRLDTWSATSEIGRVAFDNPIPRLQDRMAAISFLAPGVPIASKVLFVNEATFPKGHPTSVVTIPTLLDEYASEGAEPEVSVFNEQWDAIKAAATFT
ncbi:MAG: hypothetical protein GKR90_24945 [Pseudomonadales bacterium]|nr:hypothetical protein [Pseudomonadales bacterium]